MHEFYDNVRICLVRCCRPIYWLGRSLLSLFLSHLLLCSYCTFYWQKFGVKFRVEAAVFSAVRKIASAAVRCPAGSREQAFVYALSSAAVLQAVAKTCSTGAASKCGCGRPPTSAAAAAGATEGFRWGGCADNVAFGAEFSKTFCDARWSAATRRRRRDTRAAATNLHNNYVGRTVRIHAYYFRQGGHDFAFAGLLAR